VRPIWKRPSISPGAIQRKPSAEDAIWQAFIFGWRAGGAVLLLSAHRARLDRVMKLKEVVDKYLSVAGGYGKTTPLSALGLSAGELEKTFDQLDEDYHISRFIHLSQAAGASSFQINGFPQTHVSIDSEIQSVL
jgi:hypothetical protein